jgi:hypothetical protein
MMERVFTVTPGGASRLAARLHDPEEILPENGQHF